MDQAWKDLALFVKSKKKGSKEEDSQWESVSLQSLWKMNFEGWTDSSKVSIKSSSPLEIMRDNNLIDKFSPLQSCYIGMLAGINEAKEKLNNNKLGSKQLKLI